MSLPQTSIISGPSSQELLDSFNRKRSSALKFVLRDLSPDLGDPSEAHFHVVGLEMVGGRDGHWNVTAISSGESGSQVTFFYDAERRKGTITY